MFGLNLALCGLNTGRVGLVVCSSISEPNQQSSITNVTLPPIKERMPNSSVCLFIQ